MHDLAYKTADRYRDAGETPASTAKFEPCRIDEIDLIMNILLTVVLLAYAAFGIFWVVHFMIPNLFADSHPRQGP